MLEETIENLTQSIVHSRRYLFFTVFVGGMSTLAIEFVTSRMLQTVYGTSNIVWANVIGLVMLFLATGYFLGGKLADKRPSFTVFYGLVTLAGFCSIFFLLMTSLILRSASVALASLNVGAVISSLIGVVLALAVPVTLLGCMSPFAIRLAVRQVDDAGRTSGQIYAISTVGSILGVYLPVLLVIPTAGTRLAALIFGSMLLLTGLVGLWQVKPRPALVATLLTLLILPLLWPLTQGNIKAYEGQLYEGESGYNYVQVVRQDDCNYLLLNEGQAYHSYYCDGGRVPRISVWSIMIAAPYYNEEPVIEKTAVIGLAAGTIPKQLTRVFGPIAIDGIEIDPMIVAVGRDYFDMTEPNLNVIVGDGRYEFNLLAGPYDLVTLDAYKVPYIPWHLTTKDYFEEIQARLTPTGVVAINVGRAPQDRRLVEAITATLLEVYPTVHAVDVPGTLNTILVATQQPTTAATLQRHLANLPADSDPLLVAALETAVTHTVPAIPGNIIFTDQRAPVEIIIDSLVLRYLLQEGLVGLPGLE